MPYAFIVVGLIMIVTGARNTFRQFGAQVAGDFTGPGNFTWWIASLGAVGAVGYIPKLRPVSISFMTLIVLVFVLAEKGLFPKLTAALKAGPTAPSAAAPSASSTGFLTMLSQNLLGRTTSSLFSTANTSGAGLPSSLSTPIENMPTITGATPQ